MIQALLAKYGLMAGASAVMLGGVYIKGRVDCNEKWLKREAVIASQAVEEYKRDNEEQAESGLEDRQALRAIDHKLNQFLEERPYVSDGRTCIEPADTQRMQLDYDAVFEKRLQARRELDGAE